MGERASIAYIERIDGKDEGVFFYGHWIADNVIDVLRKALEPSGETTLVARIAKGMGEATYDTCLITPYLIHNNYPTLYVREVGSTEVALCDSETQADSEDLLWISAEEFIDYANRSDGLSYYDRFKFIDALIMDY